MAFPTGYTKYQIVTIDNTKVAATLANFPVLLTEDNFAKAGADLITIHAECDNDLKTTIQKIKDSRCLAGISVNPETSLDVIYEVIPDVDLILIMSVHPGFSGQSFIKDVLPKIKQAEELIQKTKKKIYLQVDGGINKENAGIVKENGADVLVAASFIFKSSNYAEAIRQLKDL